MSQSRRATFGEVEVAITGAKGVLALSPKFEGTAQDEQDWTSAIDWSWKIGFVVDDEPLGTLINGKVIYPVMQHRLYASVVEMRSSVLVTA